MTRVSWEWSWILVDMDILLLVLPFGTGILLKILISFLLGPAQRAALQGLDPENKSLNDDQKNVVLGWINQSTVYLTAASTLCTSLIAFLLVAVKVQKPGIWLLWVVDLVLSLCVVVFLKRLSKPYRKIGKLRVGTFVLLLSILLDVFGAVTTVTTTLRSQPAGGPHFPSVGKCGGYGAAA